MSPRRGLPGRVQRPNSRARRIVVAPLDAEAHARVAIFPVQIVESASLPAFDLVDSVLAVTVAGAEAEGVEALANACSVRGLALTGIVLRGSGKELSRSLGQLRPWVGTLLVADGDEDVLHLAEVLHGRD